MTPRLNRLRALKIVHVVNRPKLTLEAAPKTNGLLLSINRRKKLAELKVLLKNKNGSASYIDQTDQGSIPALKYIDNQEAVDNLSVRGVSPFLFYLYQGTKHSLVFFFSLSFFFLCFVFVLCYIICTAVGSVRSWCASFSRPWCRSVRRCCTFFFDRRFRWRHWSCFWMG